MKHSQVVTWQQFAGSRLSRLLKTVSDHANQIRIVMLCIVLEPLRALHLHYMSLAHFTDSRYVNRIQRDKCVLAGKHIVCTRLPPFPLCLGMYWYIGRYEDWFCYWQLLAYFHPRA